MLLSQLSQKALVLNATISLKLTNYPQKFRWVGSSLQTDEPNLSFCIAYFITKPIVQKSFYEVAFVDVRCSEARIHQYT